MRPSTSRTGEQEPCNDMQRLSSQLSEHKLEDNRGSQGDDHSPAPNGLSIKSVVLCGVRSVQVVLRIVLRFIIVLIVVHIYRRGLRPGLSTLLQWISAIRPVQDLSKVVNNIVSHIREHYIARVLTRPLPKYANSILFCATLPFAIGFYSVRTLVNWSIKTIDYGDYVLVSRKWPRLVSLCINALLMVAEECVRPFLPANVVTEAKAKSEPLRLTPSRAVLLFLMSEAIYPSSRLCSRVALTPFRIIRSLVLWRRQKLKVQQQTQKSDAGNEQQHQRSDIEPTLHDICNTNDSINETGNTNACEERASSSLPSQETSLQAQDIPVTSSLNMDNVETDNKDESKVPSIESTPPVVKARNNLLPPMTPELFELLYAEEKPEEENEKNDEENDEFERENEELQLDEFINNLEAGKDPLEAALSALKHDLSPNKIKDREDRVSVSEINITISKEVTIQAKSCVVFQECSLDKVEVESSVACKTGQSVDQNEKHQTESSNETQAKIVDGSRTSLMENENQSSTQECSEAANSSQSITILVDTIPEADNCLRTSTTCGDSTIVKNCNDLGRSCLTEEGDRKIGEFVTLAPSSRSVTTSFATSYATTAGGLLHRTSLLRQLKSIELLKRAIVQPPTISSTLYLSESDDFDAAKWLSRELVLHLPFYQHYCGAFLELKKESEVCDAATSLARCMSVLSGGDLAPEAIPFPRWFSRMWMSLSAEPGSATAKEQSSNQVKVLGEVPIFSRYSDIRRSFARLLAVILSLPSAGLLRTKVDEELCFTKFVQLRVHSCEECGEATFKQPSSLSKEVDKELYEESIRRLDLAVSTLQHSMIHFLKSLRRRGVQRAKIVGQYSSNQSVEKDDFRREISNRFISKMSPNMSALAYSTSQATDDESKMSKSLFSHARPDEKNVIDDEFLYVDPADASQNAMLRREIGVTMSSFAVGFGRVFDVACDNEEFQGFTCKTCKVMRWPARLNFEEHLTREDSPLTILETLHEKPLLRSHYYDDDQQKTSTPPRNTKATSKLGSTSNSPDLSSRTPPLSAIWNTPDVNIIKHQKSAKVVNTDDQNWEGITDQRGIIQFVEHEPGIYFWEAVDFFAHRMHLVDSPDWIVEYALIDAVEALRHKQEPVEKRSKMKNK